MLELPLPQRLVVGSERPGREDRRLPAVAAARASAHRHDAGDAHGMGAARSPRAPGRRGGRRSQAADAGGCRQRSRTRARARGSAARLRAGRGRPARAGAHPGPAGGRPAPSRPHPSRSGRCPRSAHQANACSRERCARPSLNTPICNRDSPAGVETFQPIAYLLPRIPPCQVAFSPSETTCADAHPDPAGQPRPSSWGGPASTCIRCSSRRRSRMSRGSTSTWAGSPRNVATGLARLGVRVAIVSAVGDDGHGRFVRTFLESEGVDCRWLGVHPDAAHRARVLRSVAARPLPDHVLPHADVPRLGARAAARSIWTGSPRRRCVYVSGTGLAREPSRLATMAVAEARTAAARRPCSISTGGRCCGTTPPTTPPPCACAPAWPTSCSDPTRRSPPRRARTTRPGCSRSARGRWCRSTGPTARPCTPATARAHGSPRTRSPS